MPVAPCTPWLGQGGRPAEPRVQTPVPEVGLPPVRSGSPRRALHAAGSPGTGKLQPHVAAPAQASGTPGRRAPRPPVPGPGRPRAPRRLVFGNRALMANLVFILKLLTMIFLGEEGSAGTHTLGWVLSRGSARWCAALGALTRALTSSARREPEPAAAPAARPHSHPQRGGQEGGKKRRGKRPPEEGQRAEGGRSRQFPAENSTEGGGEPPLQLPPPPLHPPIIWKLLPTSSGTPDSLRHFQADKALSRGKRLPSWRRARSREQLSPGLPGPGSKPRCHPRPAGRGAGSRAPALPPERAAGPGTEPRVCI